MSPERLSSLKDKLNCQDRLTSPFGHAFLGRKGVRLGLSWGLGDGKWRPEKGSAPPTVGAHEATPELPSRGSGGRLVLGRICQHSSVSGLPRARQC